MTHQDTPASNPVSTQPGTADSTPSQEIINPSHEPGRFVWLAIVSIVLTVLSWIGAGYSAWAGIGLAVAAIVAGAFALKSRRHGVRNTAITSIIAATVLLVVIVAFIIVIYVGLKSI